MAADITVFDPATIRDVATFEDPNHYSVGVKHVLVNGQASSPTGDHRRASRACAARARDTGRTDIASRA